MQNFQPASLFFFFLHWYISYSVSSEYIFHHCLTAHLAITLVGSHARALRLLNQYSRAFIISVIQPPLVFLLSFAAVRQQFGKSADPWSFQPLARSVQEPDIPCAQAQTKSRGDGCNWSMQRNNARVLTSQTSGCC